MMTKKIKVVVIAGTLGLLAGCQQTVSSLTPCQSYTPELESCLEIAPIGSQQWQNWVDKKVTSGDGQGHGPDIGSQEWYSVIDAKLFNRLSTEPLGSPQWNKKVKDTLIQQIRAQ